MAGGFGVEIKEPKFEVHPKPTKKQTDIIILDKC